MPEYRVTVSFDRLTISDINEAIEQLREAGAPDKSKIAITYPNAPTFTKPFSGRSGRLSATWTSSNCVTETETGHDDADDIE